MFEESCIGEMLFLLSYKDVGGVAEGQGQLTGQEIIEITSKKAKLFCGYSKTNKGDAEKRGIETPYHCS